MQQRGCEEMPLLISKYVDDATSVEEREFVDRHIAACETCACKLTEYMEVAAMFSESPTFVPAPQVRLGVFREIERLKDEERRSNASEENKVRRGWFRPSTAAPDQLPVLMPSFAVRMMRAASPFAAASVGVFAIFSLIMLNARTPISNAPLQPLRDNTLIIPPVPTSPAEKIAMGFPSPVSTGGVSPVGAPEPSASAPVRATATLGRPSVLRLGNATPVLEGGSLDKTSTWHIVRDPAFGYAISYPPNWWSQVRGSTRFFFPWTGGGTRNAPYYLDFKVEANVKALTAEIANRSGVCKLQPSGRNGLACRRTNTQDNDSAYDEIYGFDTSNVYILRLTVPRRDTSGTFSERWARAQGVFTRMTASVALVSDSSRATGSDYSQVLFLNGTDLWSVGAGGGDAQALTRGYGVHQFAQSPDLHTVAFTAAGSPNDLWAKRLYLSYRQPGSASGVFSGPQSIWSALDINDIAWYSDRQLLVIARGVEQGFGIYSIVLPGLGLATSDVPVEARLLTKLADTMSGARGLAVSPDRQLISFLAPVVEKKGTDIYVIRPDGSDLRKLVSHTEPMSPLVDGQRELPADNQAIKSYLWTDGRLEKAGYEFNLLFTGGNSSSPSLYRGGYLYSAVGSTRGPLLDPNLLGVDDPGKLQIIQFAYSPSGRVAFTGYYNDYRDRAEHLAGLWTADLLDGVLANITAQPTPVGPNGISDLQWSPDGMDLMYRETYPNNKDSWISRYDNMSGFSMVKLNPTTGGKSILYDSVGR